MLDGIIRRGSDYCGSDYSGRSPVIVEFTPDRSDPWVGYFSTISPNDPTGVYGCPSERHALVLASGQAYLVDVTDPMSFTIALE
jgi:hypothetical protein